MTRSGHAASDVTLHDSDDRMAEESPATRAPVTVSTREHRRVRVRPRTGPRRRGPRRSQRRYRGTPADPYPSRPGRNGQHRRPRRTCRPAPRTPRHPCSHQQLRLRPGRCPRRDRPGSEGRPGRVRGCAHGLPRLSRPGPPSQRHGSGCTHGRRTGRRTHRRVPGGRPAKVLGRGPGDGVAASRGRTRCSTRPIPHRVEPLDARTRAHHRTDGTCRTFGRVDGRGPA